MSKIQNVSKYLQFILYFLLFSVLIFSVHSAYSHYGYATNISSKGFLQLPVSHPISVLLCAINLIPSIVLATIIYNLIKVLKSYEQGTVFSSDNNLYLRRIGFLLLFKELSQLITTPLTTFLTRLDGVLLKEHMVLSIGMSDLCNLLIGFCIILLSWVMHEAYKLKEENSAFI